MTTATTSHKATKIVQVLARIEFKSDSRKVVYKVRSSKGGEPYTTTLFDGKATSCTCKATVKCYHMTQLEQKEAARLAVAEAETIVTSALAVDKQDGNSGYFDAEYEQWKRDNGLDGNLSREAFCTEFSIY